MPSNLKAAYRLSAIIAALAVLASGVGLFYREVYRDNDFIKAAWFANDLLTLILAVPLLLAGMRLARRGSTRGLLVWLAMLVYTLYNYAFYLFGSAFNRLFLVYVALFSLSIFALIVSVPRLNANAIRQQFHPRTPVRLISAFMLFFALVLGGLWVAMALVTVVTGDPPATLAKFEQPTAVVFALDLGVLIPGMLLGASLLWQRQPWGYVVATLMNLKAATYGFILVISTAYTYATTGIGDPLVGLYLVLGLGNLAATGLLLGNVRPGITETRQGQRASAPA